MTLTVIFSILFIHFFADFICQDEKWALGKSKNWSDLLSHTFTYSSVWLGVGSLYWFMNNETNAFQLPIFYFTIITFICHTVQDYFTSKVTSKLYAEKKFGSSIPNLGFFSVIGFDQFLHYVQLFLTYYFLTV